MHSATVGLAQDLLPPSRWRRLGVFYLDLLVGSALAHVIGVFTNLDRLYWAVALGCWTALEFLLHRPLGHSFGRYALGILATEEGDRVSKDFLERQHWLIVLLGILYTLEASKLMVRGLSEYSFFYVADEQVGGVEGRLLYIMLGGATAVVALLLFRMKPSAPFALLGLSLAILANDIASPNALRAHAQEYKAARDAARGKASPMTVEPLAKVRIIGGTAMVGVLAIGLFAMRRRFHDVPSEYLT